MKVGILTFHFSDNFGAALQAYALRKWFLNEGHDAEFVNYCPPHVEHGGKLVFGFSKKKIIANAKTLYLAYTAARTKYFGHVGQRNAFRDFRSKNLGIVSAKLKNLQELEAAAGKYDLLVCGSDQIWSPSVQYGLDPAYFLAFEASARKISFAASFGNATKDSLLENAAGALIEKLDAIAVREKSGVQLVEFLTNRKAIQVVDPTCLLDSYDDLIDEAKIEDRGHVFCYALRTDEGVRQVSSAVQGLLNKPVVAPKNPHSRWRPLGITRHPGPREWLALIDSSSFVVTNSFHGTMLSILLRKPFVVVGIPGKKVGLNDRMISLLEDVGLLDRFMAEPDLVRISSLITAEIDWETANQRLREKRRTSELYLREQLALCAK